MSFVHVYLLGGLALASVPVLVHLITRQKPKHVRFPAFRFLVQKYHTTRRKLRLHQLLLMLLRMLLIAALALALARPRLYSDRIPFLGDQQAVQVALVFDTSPSMEYERGGLTRLEDARRRALELLDSLPQGSRIVVLDSAERGGEFESADGARARIGELKVKPANGPVTRLLERAFTLFHESGTDEQDGEPPPRYVYLLSDRTRACWDAAEVRRIQVPEGVRVAFVDVGNDRPTDLAIENIEVDPVNVIPGGTATVRVVVRATGERASRNVVCQIDGRPSMTQEKEVTVEEDGRKTLVFRYQAAPPDARADEGGLPAGSHQLTVRIRGTDRLPFNNVRHATFLVRPGRKVLTLYESREKIDDVWDLALEALSYTRKYLRVDALKGIKDLAEYDVVCLFQPEGETPGLWDKLTEYVENGGKLVVVPGGDRTDVAAFNKAAERLLPARLRSAATAATELGIPWDWNQADAGSPLIVPFLRWRREQGNVPFVKRGNEPVAYRFWLVGPHEQARVLGRFSDGKESYPALLEREVGRGKVVQFTTKLDVEEERTTVGPKRGWTDYWPMFGLILTDQVCRYLAGDNVTLDLNGVCGQVMTIPLGAGVGNQFQLTGPGLPAAGLAMTGPDKKEDKPRARELSISRAVEPGNYMVHSLAHGRKTELEGFSLNVRAEESVLAPRVSKEEIEEALGQDSLLEIDHELSLREVVSRRPQPLELFPALLLLLLIFLVIENLVSNRRRDAADLSPPPEAVWSWRPVLAVAVCGMVGAGIGAVPALMNAGASESRYNPFAGAFALGLLGLSHGLLSGARFGPRDGGILGGILGSMAGVLFGWLVLGPLGVMDESFALFVGLVAGTGLLAADGWFLGMRAARVTGQEG